MCYAKPGRRCQSHAREHLEDTKRKYKDAIRELNARSDALMAEQNQNGTQSTPEMRQELRTLWHEVNRRQERADKAQIDYDATEQGLQELRTLVEEKPTDKSLAQRLKYATLRAHWQTVTYESLKGLEDGDGFGKVFALRDALQEATRDLAFQQNKLAKTTTMSKQERYITQLAVKDLQSYIATVEKKIDKELSLNELLRRRGDQLLEGKTFITMNK